MPTAHVRREWSRRRTATAIAFAASLLVLAVTAQTSFAQRGDGVDLIPDSPAGRAYRDFVAAYNTGTRAALEEFVTDHYAPATNVGDKTDDWLALFYKYGPVRVHGVSIDGRYDLEMWLHGTITRAWFAVELILNEETGRIRAVGILQGERPDDAPPIDVAREDFPRHLETYLRLLSDRGYFSGTVLVAHRGRPIYEGAFGMADQADGVAMHVDTRLAIASVTKMFTGVAVARLVESGKLSFDDDIAEFVPEYPTEISQKVTVHHLLTHTSGIELDEIPDFNRSKQRASSSEDLLRAHLRHVDSLYTNGVFELPSKYDYSNEGYDLAGLIVERVSGQSLLDYFTEHIFEPSGMLRTGRYPVDPAAYDVAIGYTHYTDKDYTFSDEEVPNTYSLDRALFGSAGLYSTVGDLNRFVNTLFYTDDLLSPDMRDTVLSPQVPRSGSEAYGYGFTLVTDEGVRSIGHNGGMIGASAEVRYFPESEYTVIVLASRRTIAITVSNYIRDAIARE
jgi:CubicO group peptidase (beta-lactamase class C family)